MNSYFASIFTKDIYISEKTLKSIFRVFCQTDLINSALVRFNPWCKSLRACKNNSPADMTDVAVGPN